LLDLNKRFHFIGIGGVGMSALAFILHDMGATVSGSDTGDSNFMERLLSKGIRVFRKHDPSNLEGVHNVIYSSAISPDNPELAFAKALGLNVMHRAELLKMVMDPYERIGITGTHGKTTTSAMSLKVLMDARLDPSGVIGGDFPYIGGNYRLGRGRFFIAEIDESDGSFLYFSGLRCLVITNIEEEHLEHYGSFEELKEKIKKLAEVCELVIYNADDPNLGEMRLKGVSYGFESGSFRGRILGDRSLFVDGFGRLDLYVAGVHNLSNALGVLALCDCLGIDKGKAMESLSGFKGVKRRMEVLGEAEGIIFMDDYAHHPTEIRAVLLTLRKLYRDKRLVVLFQPHRYSRTARMYKEMADSLRVADWIGITEIYSASEVPIEGISGKLIYETLRVAGIENAYFFPDIEIAKDVLKGELKKEDIFITMGAGDVYKVGRALLVEFKGGCS